MFSSRYEERRPSKKEEEGCDVKKVARAGDGSFSGDKDQRIASEFSMPPLRPGAAAMPHNTCYVAQRTATGLGSLVREYLLRGA